MAHAGLGQEEAPRSTSRRVMDDTRPHTLYDKLWHSHVVQRLDEDQVLLYIDRHLINEVTSPQAFAGLREAGRRPWREGSIIATADHNVPTRAEPGGIADTDARMQVEALDSNIRWSGARAYFPLHHPRQGIVHVVAPELGITLPGMTIVCGDSHTSTHGAFGALAFGIGTSDVEHVLATQTLALSKSRNFRVALHGSLPPGVHAKDAALAVIAAVGAGGGTGHVIEFVGGLITQLSMEARMTLCNMAIEAGARAGLVAVDEVTLDYVVGRPMAPGGSQWLQAQARWRGLHSDPGAHFDKEHQLDVSALAPMVTWGTSPDMAVPVDGCVPDPAMQPDPARRLAMQRALEYMALLPGTRMADIAVDKVFIGSCTNARIEDLRVAARIVAGGRVAAGVKQALVVPGSGQVRRQAEEEGLDRVFLAAGFEWRGPGCSMCLGMNADRLEPGERCASTSNRNFEGRQGRGGRSHLVSPATAAWTALNGRLADVREAL